MLILYNINSAPSQPHSITSVRRKGKKGWFRIINRTMIWSFLTCNWIKKKKKEKSVFLSCWACSTPTVDGRVRANKWHDWWNWNQWHSDPHCKLVPTKSDPHCKLVPTTATWWLVFVSYFARITFCCGLLVWAYLLGDSGGVVNSLDFCLASLKSLGCFYFRCVLSSQWKAVTVNLRILHCQR